MNGQLIVIFALVALSSVDAANFRRRQFRQYRLRQPQLELATKGGYQLPSYQYESGLKGHQYQSQALFRPSYGMPSYAQGLQFESATKGQQLSASKGSYQLDQYEAPAKGQQYQSATKEIQQATKSVDHVKQVSSGIKQEAAVQIESKGQQFDSVKGLQTQSSKGQQFESVKGLQTQSVKGLQTESVKGLQTESVKGLQTQSSKGQQFDSVKGLQTQAVKGQQSEVVKGQQLDMAKGQQLDVAKGQQSQSFQQSAKIESAEPAKQISSSGKAEVATVPQTDSIVNKQEVPLKKNI